MSTRPPYRREPYVRVRGHETACVAGWEAVGERLRRAVGGHGTARGSSRVVVAAECYPGVLEDEVLAALVRAVGPDHVLATREALRPPAEIEALVAADLTDDPVFGRLSALTLDAFFDPARGASARDTIAALDGRILVYGVGATLLCDPDLLVYADLARWEIQGRFRRSEAENLGAQNADAPWQRQYKRAFFIDWRVADRHKRSLFERVDYFLDTNRREAPLLAEGHAIRDGLRQTARRPFSVVPYFDPAPWGGQWMRKTCGLDDEAENYGWSFNCVPEENSLLLAFGEHRFELPAIDLVFFQPSALLGDDVYARFGAEFPIRFDFLDTIEGGNLSFQVHPVAAYAREEFGLPYTQDESYYLLEAAPGATVYLGLREGVDRDAMLAALRDAQEGGAPFPAERYANRWPAHKHDHFLIPAGTVHCSGSGSMVLEISATPYLFTFKLWDWGRLGLDGRPRPIHLDRGAANIRWERTTAWARDNLLNRTEVVAEGEGWREERTGLHELELIETRRHWFETTTCHDTNGTLNVLCVVEGDGILVESPSGAFDPFPVHYAEVFVVPAAVGPYTLRPACALGSSDTPGPGDRDGPADEGARSSCATVKAWIR